MTGWLFAISRIVLGSLEDLEARLADCLELLVLAAIWGASFIFLKVAAPEFGPVPLAAIRVGGGSALLLPLALRSNSWRDFREKWRPLLVAGLSGTGVPFVFYGFAASHLDASVAAILNATSPAWAVLIASLWLRQRIAVSSAAGIVLGIAAVGYLSLERSAHHESPMALAVACALAATCLYGFSATYARRTLVGMNPLRIAAGGQLLAAATLAPAAALTWPRVPPSSTAWAAAAALAFVCTGLAYVSYYRVIARSGAVAATSVTFLVPMFGMLWGSTILGEHITMQMLVASAAIVAATFLSTAKTRGGGNTDEIERRPQDDQ